MIFNIHFYIYIVMIYLYKLKIGQRPAHKPGSHWFIFQTDTGLAQSHLLTPLVYWWVVSNRWAGLSEKCQGHFFCRKSSPAGDDLLSAPPAQYDARSRVLIRHVSCLLRVSHQHLEEFEESLGERLREGVEESE